MKKEVSLTEEEGGPGKYHFYNAYEKTGRKGEKDRKWQKCIPSSGRMSHSAFSPSPVFRNLAGGRAAKFSPGAEP